MFFLSVHLTGIFLLCNKQMLKIYIKTKKKKNYMYVEATQPVNASEILTRVSFRLLSYLIYTLLVCFGLELFFFFTELLPIWNLTLFLLLFLQSLCYLRIYFLIYDCCKHLTKVYFKIFKQMSPSPDRTWS